MASPTFEEEFTETIKLLSLDELKDILSYAYVLLASRKQGVTNGLSANQWSRIPKKHRLAFGEFAKTWLAVNGHWQKENALSGQQPTESNRKDGRTANLQS